jgi:hypothetical protein
MIAPISHPFPPLQGTAMGAGLSRPHRGSGRAWSSGDRFAPGGSTTSGELHPTVPASQEEVEAEGFSHLAMASGYVEAYRSKMTQSIAASTWDTGAAATEIRVSDIP